MNIISTLIKLVILFQCSNGYQESIQPFNISKECSVAMKRYEKAISDQETWALQIMDASAKIGAGLLNENMGNFGEFEECLNSEFVNGSDVIYGKYCIATTADLGHFHLQPVCFPSPCSPEEFQTFNLGTETNVQIMGSYCYTKFSKPKLDQKAIIALTILGSLVLLSTFATIYDICASQEKARSTCHDVILCFSIIRNSEKLLKTNSNPRHITCANGMRSLSMMWIVLGHKYGIHRFFPVTNYIFVREWIQSTASMFICNANLSVETFFVLSGMALSYTFLSTMSNKDMKFNLFLHYIDRYMRFTVLLAFLVLLNVSLLKFIAFNPAWMVFEPYARVNCEKYWWSTLLHIQNYVNIGHLCIGPSWFLSVDMQLYVLSPPLLLLLLKKPFWGYLVTWILVLCFIMINMAVVWIYRLHPLLAEEMKSFQSNDRFFRYYYFTTYAHVSTYCVGLFVGCLLYKSKIQGNCFLTKVFGKYINITFWALALVAVFACAFTGHNLVMKYDKIGTTINVVIKPVAWAIAIGWMIFACGCGYGGPINWFLSLPMFEVLSKLTFSLLLIHFLMEFITTSYNYNYQTAGNFEILHGFWGDYMFSVIASIFLVIFIEFPFANLKRTLLTRKISKDENNRKADNES